MNRIYPTLSFILLLGLHATPSFSQNDDFVKQFQQSRQAMLDDYNKFRNTPYLPTTISICKAYGRIQEV